ncbi:MAG: flagellar basal body P-ring formation protein FlgA [Rhodospirillaceae bacterium]|nr:flagellar basal body P-ring formation protein FlgA [Rhodospirillaceae bacterium]
MAYWYLFSGSRIAWHFSLVAVLALLSSPVQAAPKGGGGLNTLSQDQKVTLNDAVIVEDSYILLGDLFNNAGEKAGTKIAYAPQPGKRSHFDATWLYRVARAYGLKWRPLTLKTKALVERASQQIDREEIEDALIAHFQDQGYRDKFEIELGNRSLKIHVAANDPATIDIVGLSANRSTGRFVATMVIPANTPGAKRYRLTGRLHKLVQIPVISRRLSRGDVVKKNDIEWIDVRERTIKRGYIQDESQIIGMAARRYTQAKTPLTTSHMQRPQLVTKGGLVTISLNSGLMSLKTQGRALETGSLGDTIRVKNGRSKKIVEAIVTGAGNVKVSLLKAVALN